MDTLTQTTLRHSLFRPICGPDTTAPQVPGEGGLQNAYQAAHAKIPGLALDFEKLIAADPIECDPLVAQGNLTILRFDELFREVYEVWRKTAENPVQTAEKRILKPVSSDNSEENIEKTELTSKQTPPDPALINQAVNVLLASFRVQATITHRRDQLKYLASGGQLSPSGGMSLASGGRKSPEVAPRPPRSADALIRGVAKLPGLSAETTLASNSPLNPSEDEFEPALPPQAPPEFPPKIPHPQYTAPLAEGEKEWPFFIPPGMDVDDETKAKPWQYPVYARPPGPHEKVHYYPPFASAKPEDADEIDAYLASLPPEVTADKKVGSLWNSYLAPPVWRKTETELEYRLKHLRLRRATQRAQASLPRTDLPLDQQPQPDVDIPLSEKRPFHPRE